MHRSVMNEQYIPFYDEASSKWLNMVETGINSIDSMIYILKVENLQRVLTMMHYNKFIDATGGDITDEELDMLEED